ncbi:MAG: hypothetical protein JJU19_00130 [Pararhodobacter sp.]|nr:hypothetical protein [Pararhodobacter sp.]
MTPWRLTRLSVTLVLPGLLLTGACSPGALALRDGPAPDHSTRIASECRLLERAQAETMARNLPSWPDVLAGCPGHESVVPAMTMAQASDATRRANRASLPEQVSGAGARAEIVYRRMITRGVPPAVAEAMTATAEFAAAIR